MTESTAARSTKTSPKSAPLAMSWATALARMSSAMMTSDAAPPAPPGPGLQPVELRSASRSAEEKATAVRPAALLPMNDRRVMP